MRRRHPTSTPRVWALQTGEGRRYARVNTDRRRARHRPQRQQPRQGRRRRRDAVYLFSDSFSKVTRSTRRCRRTSTRRRCAPRRAPRRAPPRSSRRAISSAYRTDSGAVFAGLSSRRTAAQLDPFPTERRGSTRSTPPMRSRSTIAACSSAIRAPTARCCATTSRPSSVHGRDPLDADGSRGARDHRGGRRLGGRRRRRTATSGCAGRMLSRRRRRTGTVVVGAAGPRRRGRVPRRRDGSRARRGRRRRHRQRGRRRHGAVAGDSGAARRPRRRGLRGVAAAGRRRRRAVESSGGQIALDYGGRTLGDERRPAFVASDEAVILNETR